MKKALLLCSMALLMSLCLALPRNLVVVEIGTGTWCQYCPGAAMGADDLIANGHSVAIIENHNGDNYANTYSNARNSYYAITGYPTAVFDGLNPSVGGSNNQSMYSNYLPKVNSRINVPSHYTISATGTMNGNDISIQATIEKPEADTNTNVVLHCAITESHITHSWQGQDHLNFVNRLMLPNQNGTPVSLATGGQQTVSLQGSFASTWNMNTCEVVLFLQNTSTKEVLQGIKYTLPGLLGVNPVSATQIDFPATYVGGTSQQSFEIHNYFGSVITGTFGSDNPAFSLPQATFSIPAYQSISVNVNFTPAAAQNYTGTLSINSNLPGYNQVNLNMSGSGFNNAAPSITDPVISGPPVIYQALSAMYDFSDPDSDTEGTSLFQWMRIINNIPNAIDGAQEATYVVQPEDLGWRLAYQVTPVDEHGMPGTPVLSAYSLPIEELPAPRNLTGSVSPPNNVVLNWEKPMYFDGRGFIGYRLFRDGTVLANVMNVNTLTYTDLNVPDGSHSYYIVSIFSNPLDFSNPSNTITIQVSVSNDDELAPGLESLSVFPNPFRENLSFRIKTKTARSVQVDIYNLKGQLVKSIAQRSASGNTVITWNAKDDRGTAVDSGIYLYRVKGEGFIKSGRIVLSE